MKNNSLSWNKVFAAARLIFAEIRLNIKPLIFAAPLFLLLVAYIMKSDMSGMVTYYLRITMLFVCTIVLLIFNKFFQNGDIMRKLTLPITHQEKFAGILLSILVWCLMCMLYCIIVGAIILVILGEMYLNADVQTVLSSFAAFFTNVRSLIYLFLACAFFLFISGTYTPRKYRRRSNILFASLFVLLIASTAVTVMLHEMIIFFIYQIVAVVACLIGVYYNIKHIQTL